MGLFSRRKPAPPTPDDRRAAIAAFWQWWAGISPELADAIPAGRLPSYADAISGRVHAIDSRLAWEFGAGTGSEHQLTVTAGGDPDLRRVARRWLRAAPTADATWAFHDLRQPSGLNATLQIGDQSIHFADVRVAATRSGSGLDVVVSHPVFGQLAEGLRGQITFLALDAALGEEAVELWLDGVEAGAVEAPGARPLAALPGIVADVVADVMPEGEMGWALMEGQGPRGPVLVLALNRLSSVQAPDLDQHVAVDVPYADRTEAGLPGAGSLDALRHLEEHLSQRIDGSGRLVAVESSAGVRTLHFYVDSTTTAADQVRVASEGWPQGRVTVNVELDPGWEAVRPFRT